MLPRFIVSYNVHVMFVVTEAANTELTLNVELDPI
jgi:hypothetical protein